MVKEILIPKENIAKVEEVREIDNQEQKQKKLDEKQENKSKIVESVREAIVPTIHASDKDDDDLDAKIE